MTRLVHSSQLPLVCLGITAFVLAMLALPGYVYADSAQVTQCNIYCQQTYTGPMLTSCLADCTSKYGATCGSDCNCGGNANPMNRNGTNCDLNFLGDQSKARSCTTWCLCSGCTKDAEGNYDNCNCGPGPVGSGGGPGDGF